MYAIVVTIDSFDHGSAGYANPAVVAPGLPKPRSGLFGNYDIDMPRHTDRRMPGGATAQRYAAFTSPVVEQYQHLLLHNTPLYNGAVHAGHALRLRRATDRFDEWQLHMLPATVPALELLNVDWHNTGLAVRSLRLGPPGLPPIRRFRLDITPAGAVGVGDVRCDQQASVLVSPARATGWTCGAQQPCSEPLSGGHHPGVDTGADLGATGAAADRQPPGARDWVHVP